MSNRRNILFITDIGAVANGTGGADITNYLQFLRGVAVANADIPVVLNNKLPATLPGASTWYSPFHPRLSVVPPGIAVPSKRTVPESVCKCRRRIKYTNSYISIAQNSHGVALGT